MQLLDAILAFALTLAALATIVTVIMEAGLRIARMRKKNFIEVMKLLNKELGKGTLEMTDEERWEFFVRVVNNPVEAPIDKLKPELDKLALEDRLAYFGRDKAAGAGLLKRVWNFVAQIFGDKKRAGLYENVSLEYMLRCLAETEAVKKASQTASNTLKVEFNRIARKYEELGSSVSASFKHHAQGWSIGIGILLAIFANIDGLRIFEAYRTDPALASAVIAKQDALLNIHTEAQASIEEFKKVRAHYEKSAKEWKKVSAGTDDEEINRAQAVLTAAQKALEEQDDIKEITKTVQNARQQYADLITIGAPVGWDFYPNCPYGDNEAAWLQSSRKCRTIPEAARKYKSQCVFLRVMQTAWNDRSGFFLWLIIVVVSGVLIGLGAPFWFDVAKRLSQIRKGLQSASASSEYRLSASDANGDYNKRKEIVENVLADAAAEAGEIMTGVAGGSK